MSVGPAPSDSNPLPPAVVEDVIEKLGLGTRPSVDRVGLAAVYRAWCRRVPFDNIRKRIALSEGLAGPLPGDTPEDFLAAWVAHGTGGTCWSGNGALHGLLRSLGFAARRGIGTMLSRPGLGPNHGTVLVHLDGSLLLVDASMLHDEPVPLDEGAESRVDHRAWGVQCRRSGGRLFVRWHPLRVETMDCRIEKLDAPPGAFTRGHELSRKRSGFNGQLTVRVIRGSTVVGVVRGELVVRDQAGRQRTEPLQGEARRAFLMEELGISQEMAERFPADEPRRGD